jgi:hypothetical protein
VAKFACEPVWEAAFPAEGMSAIAVCWCSYAFKGVQTFRTVIGQMGQVSHFVRCKMLIGKGHDL